MMMFVSRVHKINLPGFSPLTNQMYQHDPPSYAFREQPQKYIPGLDGKIVLQIICLSRTMGLCVGHQKAGEGFDIALNLILLSFRTLLFETFLCEFFIA